MNACRSVPALPVAQRWSIVGMSTTGGHGVLKLWVLVAVQASVAAASLVVEIVAGRMLAPYVGMSLYTWTSVIAVVLAGFSAGHWLGGRWAEHPPARALTLNAWALAGAALTTALAVFVLRAVSGPVLGVLDTPVAGILALTLLVFFLPSFFAGIPAPILSMIAVHRHPEHEGRALGAMFASGAWGAIIGTLAAGFVFVSWLGAVGTLAVVTGVYALLALWSWLAAGHARPIAGALALCLAVGVAGAGLMQSNPCTVESRYFCIRTVDLSQDPADPVRLMVLDHLVHGLSSGNEPRAMLSPHGMMLDALPRLRMEGRETWSAFLIGGGTYTLPRAWATLSPAPDVTVAELDPAVTEVAQRDFWYAPGQDRIVHADARRTLAREDRRYDVIVGDAFSDIAVPQHLITAEFFALVHARLNEGGVYVMNVIDHMDSLRVLSSMVATARQTWPVVEVWADPDHESSETRRVFVMVAGDTPSTRSQVADPLTGRRTIRIAADSVQTLLDTRDPVVFTDDYAPIDRLMGDTGI